MRKRSLTPRWPLTPHVWLYPRIIVSKSHENTTKCVDTVTLFAKTWTKGHWLLDNLWPHICWGHMCDSTQGSLCPSPMGIHQCMWIQWSILQITTYIHVLRITYYIQNEWSHSLFLNTVQATQKVLWHLLCGELKDIKRLVHTFILVCTVRCDLHSYSTCYVCML